MRNNCKRKNAKKEKKILLNKYYNLIIITTSARNSLATRRIQTKLIAVKYIYKGPAENNKRKNKRFRSHTNEFRRKNPI